MYKSKLAIVITLIVATIILVVGIAPASSGAASHREAPLISLDPTADITDFFMFRSYEDGHSDKIVLIMDVIPGEEPSSAPNYWNFDDNVLYAFYLDNDMDGFADDVVFEFQFKTEFRGTNKDLGLFLSYVALPPITALDGDGSEGLGLRQKYTVTMVRDGYRQKLAEGLIAVPSNVGPRTIPNYDALAAQGIYDLGNGIRVFAGQRDDPFYIDLGAIFDTLFLRSPGVDMLSGFNVNTIALEVPASLLTQDGQGPDDTAHPVLGAYAATSRRTTTVLTGKGKLKSQGNWVQVQRLANPLVNETIIGTEFKDLWNAQNPAKEAQFEDFFLKPRLALALQVVLGLDAATGGLDGVDPPRSTLGAPFDLVNLLLKYQPDDQQLSELLRLNISVPPVPLDQQERLTALAGDSAGWPNGRRPNDDVLDVAVQVVGGPEYVGVGAGDAVDENDRPLPDAFPFLSTPWDGRNRFHTNP